MNKILSLLTLLSLVFLSGCIDPTIESISPQDGDTNVSANTAITVVLRSALDESTLNDDGFKLTESVSGTSVAGSFSYDSSTFTITFTPTSALSLSTQYTATSTGSILNAKGTVITATSWSFTTEASTTTISSFSPASAATDVAIDTTISLTLSDTLDETTLNTSNVQLRDSTTNTLIAGSFSYDSATNIITFTPSSSLDYETSYSVTTTTGLLDKDGHSITAASWSFTTVADITTITSFSPDSDATGVLTNTTIVATLSDKLDSSSLDSDSFQVEKSSTSSEISGTLAYDSDDLTITFTPSDALEAETKYTVSTSSALLAANGNSVTSANSSFTTEDYIVRLSVSKSGTEGNAGASSSPFLNDDGQYALFTSTSTNLVDTDTNGKKDIFRVDTINTTREKVVVSSSTETNEDLEQGTPDNDGNLVAFSSSASNLVSGDSNGVSDVFTYNWSTDTLTRVSVHSDGTEGNAASTNPSLSGNGTHVAFYSTASNLIDGEVLAFEDLYLSILRTVY